MAKLFIAAAVAYLLTTLLVAGSALVLTLWAHQTGSEPLQDLVSASILHTAAACAAMGFVGGFDMFFTIWQLMRNNQLEDERRKEREEDRKGREEDRQTRVEERQALAEDRKARDEDRKAREEERKTQAAEREAERQAREEERKTQAAEREAERQAREEERAMTRRIQEEILAQLQAERVYRDEMTARVMELTYQLAGRDNGGSAAPTDRE